MTERFRSLAEAKASSQPPGAAQCAPLATPMDFLVFVKSVSESTLRHRSTMSA